MENQEVFVTSDFEKSLKSLVKRFPSIKQIFKQVLTDLKAPGIGVEIQGHQGFYKVRYPNKDAGKGKRGGYRVIYFWSKEDNLIVLVDIYSKTDQNEVDWRKVQQTMKELENGT